MPHSLGRNQQVIGTDGLALFFQFGPEQSRDAGVIGVEVQDGERADQKGSTRALFVAGLALFGTPYQSSKMVIVETLMACPPESALSKRSRT